MELYKKVRLACAEGMSARAAAKHFNVSRGTVEKMLAFSVPPGYRRLKPRGTGLPSSRHSGRPHPCLTFRPWRCNIIICTRP